MMHSQPVTERPQTDALVPYDWFRYCRWLEEELERMREERDHYSAALDCIGYGIVDNPVQFARKRLGEMLDE